MNLLNSLSDIVATIERRVAEGRQSGPLFVAVSGIDGSGKTFLAARVVEELRKRSLGVAPLNIDQWHTPPAVRFGKERPGEHFYEHAFRWDDLFRLVIDPLREKRSVHVTVDITRLPENDIYPHLFSFENVDVILLEGIFILKRELVPRYDLKIWVECSFETALARALLRNQEGLSQEEIRRDYDTIYFAAQRYHFAKDDPRAHADFVLMNDTPPT